VQISDWDCTLEGNALRLGLRMVSGLSEKEGKRIAAGRPYASIHEMKLNTRDLRALAAAGALQPLAGHRRLARWAAAGAARRAPLDVPAPERLPVLRPPREGEEIVADYASLGLTLGRHPLALLRKRLEERNLITARELLLLPHGRAAQVAGLVTCRQRPDTASGVVFVTLEDETGCMNIVVWRNLVESQRPELLGARLMGVRGVVERDGDVVHLVARRLSDYSALLGPLAAPSRDFH
jgi:error-prone DNA polymerase